MSKTIKTLSALSLAVSAASLGASVSYAQDAAMAIEEVTVNSAGAKTSRIDGD